MKYRAIAEVMGATFEGRQVYAVLFLGAEGEYDPQNVGLGLYATLEEAKEAAEGPRGGGAGGAHRRRVISPRTAPTTDRHEAPRPTQGGGFFMSARGTRLRAGEGG